MQALWDCNSLFPCFPQSGGWATGRGTGWCGCRVPGCLWRVCGSCFHVRVPPACAVSHYIRVI